MSFKQTLARIADGVRLFNGRPVQDAAGSLINADASYGLTAQASGTQANATPLTYGLNAVDTVATNNDSAQLPAATAGARVYVANNGGATLRVFGKNGRTDTINGTAGATGVTQGTGVHAIYFCAQDGKWSRVLSA